MRCFLKTAGFEMARSWCGSWFQTCGPAKKRIKRKKEKRKEKRKLLTATSRTQAVSMAAMAEPRTDTLDNQNFAE